MSDLKSKKERFNDPSGMHNQKDDSFKVQQNHTRWRKEIQQLKKEKSIKGKSYWEMFKNAL